MPIPRNFSTAPYLHKLAREANTHAALIRRLIFGMPNFLLKPLANGFLMGKILVAAPAAIPIRIDPNDKPYLAAILNEVDKSIRATARTITRTKLIDKVRSEVTLRRSGLKSLTEAVSVTIAALIWKAKKDMGHLALFLKRNLLSKTPDQNKMTIYVNQYQDTQNWLQITWHKSGIT